jgi:hypothetical protein
MRRLFLTIAGVTALAASSGANAALTITTTPGVDPYAGPAPTYTFDVGSRPGGATTSNFFTGTNGLINAQPFGTAAGTGAYGGAGYYFAVGPGTSTPGLIDLTSIGDIGSISFIWGSVDSYNTLDILDGSMNVLYTIVGNTIFNPANGNRTDPNTNPLVTLNFTLSDVQNVSFLRLSSSQNAFEIDNLRVSGVPEPATWAMMLLGFGGIGLAMRRRRRPALAQLA